MRRYKQTSLEQRESHSSILFPPLCCISLETLHELGSSSPPWKLQSRESCSLHDCGVEWKSVPWSHYWINWFQFKIMYPFLFLLSDEIVSVCLMYQILYHRVFKSDLCWLPFCHSPPAQSCGLTFPVEEGLHIGVQTGAPDPRSCLMLAPHLMQCPVIWSNMDKEASSWLLPILPQCINAHLYVNWQFEEIPRTGGHGVYSVRGASSCIAGPLTERAEL